MKAIVSKASEYRYKETITFNTLKELLDWQKEIKENIIIDLPVNGIYHIMIYDDYVE